MNKTIAQIVSGMKRIRKLNLEVAHDWTNFA